ncbi:MAG: hypothetical protein IIA88_12250 [Bacteroidetes bacterium]|nr:hypothetical protein [Bacteroidota bacterium]
MFISTLLLIPWIIFGFRNPDEKFLRLNQTKRSLTTLLIVEIAYFSILLALLGDKNHDVAGSRSFAWTYSMIYEKGIFPAFGLAELIDPVGGDRLDSDYPVVYLMIALIMDYIILTLISPKTMRLLKIKKSAANKS